MKAIILFACCLSAIISVGQQNREQRRILNVDSFLRATQEKGMNKPFPEFSVTQGTTLTNADLKGKITFINFWFAACAPCVAEFGGLNELYDKLKDNKDVKFLSFTFESPEKVAEFAEKYKMPYKAISVEESECRRLNFNAGFPANIILDRDGVVRFFKIGGSVDKAEASRVIVAEVYSKIMAML